MNNIAGYQEHVEIVKNLKMHSDFTNVREPYKEDFEKIRQEAQNQGVGMSNAKDFLNSLSKDELHTLQKYSGLADEISVGRLSDEGAYNLLLEHYEKFDFNQDGVTEDGIAKTGDLIPFSMPNAEKKALVETLNQMDEKDSFMALMFVSLPDSFELDGEGSYMPKYNKNKDYNDIMAIFDRILNPGPMEYSSPEVKALASKFMTMFEENYQKEKEFEASHYANHETSANIMKAKLS